MRLSQGLQSGSDVHSITKHVTFLLSDVAQMDTNADVDLFPTLLLYIVIAEEGLYLLGALDGVHDEGKIDQEGIADRFDDQAVMFSNSLLNNLIVDIEQAQPAGFIHAHLAAKADDVG